MMIQATKVNSLNVFCSVLNENVVVLFKDIDWEGGKTETGFYAGSYDGSVLGTFKCKCGELHEMKIN